MPAPSRVPWTGYSNGLARRCGGLVGGDHVGTEEADFALDQVLGGPAGEIRVVVVVRALVALGVAEAEQHRVAGADPRVSRFELLEGEFVRALAADVDRHPAADEALDRVLVDRRAVGEEVAGGVDVGAGVGDHGSDRWPRSAPAGTEWAIGTSWISISTFSVLRQPAISSE